MAEQYFEASPTSAHDEKALKVHYRGQNFTFVTDAGVFSREGLDEGSLLMLDSVFLDLDGQVLDLGCGWGPLGTIISKLKKNCQVTMTDINERATNLAQLNLKANGARATVVTGDGLSQVEGLFDWILLNPPIRAGKQVIYRLFEEASRQLEKGGRLVVVIRKQQGALSAKDYLGTLFDEITLLNRKKGYHVFYCGGSRHEV